MREWSTLRKLMFLKGATGVPLHEYTATGNPVKFETNKAKPLTKLLCAWTPTQSGTGDPAPDNVRPITGMDGVKVWQTGKNLLNIAEFVDSKVWWDGIIVNGYTSYKASNKIPVVPNAKYTLKRSEIGQNQLQYFDAEGSYLRQVTNVLGYEVTTFTIPDDVYFIGINIAKTSADTAQLEVGETATAYEPYHGTTYAVEFPALGKNLFDKSTTIYNAIISSHEIYETANGRTAYVPCLPNTTYTISKVATTRAVIAYATTEGIPQNGGSVYGEIDYRNTTSASITTGADAKGLVLYLTNVGYDKTPIETVLDSVMLNVGSTALPYEPYTNTVYGGTLDLTTGVLTAEWARVKISDLTGWTYQSNQWGGRFRATLKEKAGSTSVEANLLCPIYKASTYTSDDNIILGYGTGNSGLVYIKDGRYTDEEDFVNGVGDEYIYYPLATPQTYQLTPKQVTALLGNNTIWSDANGDCEVKYLKKG